MRIVRQHPLLTALAALAVGAAALAVGLLALRTETSAQPEEFTRDYVRQAVEMYRAEGREKTLAYYSSEASIDGRWYLFVIDAERGVVLAHPAEQSIGLDLTAKEAYDHTGYFYAAGLMQATPEGVFVRNSISIPTLKEQHPSYGDVEEAKHYYAVLEDGLIFVSGWYTPPPTKDGPAEYARLLVGRALVMYDDLGLEATLERYNSPDSLDGPWYVWILEDRDGDLYTVANAYRPGQVGTTRERVDASGFDRGKAFAAVTEEGGGEWVTYLYMNPQTGNDEPKHAWVVRRDNLRFGAGWYAGIGE